MSLNSTLVPSQPGARPRVSDDAFLRWLKEYHAKHGFAPSIRETATAFGVNSTSNAVYRLRRLADRGLVKRARGVARSLTLTRAGRQLV